jgi:DNA-binding NtrC family response regulator
VTTAPINYTDSILDEVGAIALCIDRESGEIFDCRGNAGPAIDGAELAGRHWREALGLAAPGEPAAGDPAAGDPAAGNSPLARALEAGLDTVLPPLLLRPAAGRALVAGGLLLSRRLRDRDALVLLLRELAYEGFAAFATGAAATGRDASDWIAVLGLDVQACDGSGVRDTAGLMRDIRRGLQQILRARDRMGPPRGTAMPLLLRGADGGVADICRALQSHLCTVLAASPSGALRTRVCIGLARVAPGEDLLCTLYAANNAFLQARLEGNGEGIRVAREGDGTALAAVASEAFGLFSAGRDDSGDTGGPECQSTCALPGRSLETGIEGYVGDNMEGAIDQAVFLSRVDTPVAIVGPRGTGKMYVAKIIHRESGGAPDALVLIDCSELRSRREALRRIAAALQEAAGKTLVLKSPHLMHGDAQLRLARQISTRVLAEVSPPRYLTDTRFIALFPDELEHLIRCGALQERLAGVFAGYPIRVPPLRDRGRAVLRWAHKILGQESACRARRIIGFTPDAEQALLLHDWPGNISEMRGAIAGALDRTDKEWITPVDLGIFRGASPASASRVLPDRPFLRVVLEEVQEVPHYTPSALERLTVALGVALHALLEQALVEPLGAWLDDEVVVAACDRYRGNRRAAAEFLHTRPRNLNRWLPGIAAREAGREASTLWQEPRRLVREWIGETAPPAEAPQLLAQALLLSHVVEQCEGNSVAERARIMGVSTPTYQKRLRAIQRGSSRHAREEGG